MPTYHFSLFERTTYGARYLAPFMIVGSVVLMDFFIGATAADHARGGYVSINTMWLGAATLAACVFTGRSAAEMADSWMMDGKIAGITSIVTQVTLVAVGYYCFMALLVSALMLFMDGLGYMLHTKSYVMGASPQIWFAELIVPVAIGFLYIPTAIEVLG
jgi:hypothetical protein